MTTPQIDTAPLPPPLVGDDAPQAALLTAERVSDLLIALERMAPRPPWRPPCAPPSPRRRRPPFPCNGAWVDPFAPPLPAVVALIFRRVFQPHG